MKSVRRWRVFYATSERDDFLGSSVRATEKSLGDSTHQRVNGLLGSVNIKRLAVGEVHGQMMREREVADCVYDFFSLCVIHLHNGFLM